MRISKLSDMHRGWFVGDFVPSVLRTKDFEVGVLTHKRGECWPEHYHKISTEINVLLSGSMTLNGIHISAGDIFVVEPCESARPVFLDDCTVLCVKTPSVIGDKYETIRE